MVTIWSPRGYGTAGMRSTVKLTKRIVDAATATGRRSLLWDSELRGFGVRVANSGTKTYFVRYRSKAPGAASARRFVVIGRHGVVTTEDARNKARALLSQAAIGEDPVVEREKRKAITTVRALVELFLTQHVEAKRKPGTYRGYRSLLEKHVVPTIGSLSAEHIAPQKIAELHLKMRDTPYQANRILTVLKSMYTFAGKRGLIPRLCNPARDIEKYREQARERFLNVEELARIGEALRLAETTGIPWKPPVGTPSKHRAKPENQRTLLPAPALLAIRLLIFTGARKNEILTLEWSHVDLERGLLLLPDSKTGRKTIVLNSAAIELLRNAPRDSCFVVPGDLDGAKRTDLKKPWATILRYADLEGVRIHDLRHTFASFGAGSNLGLPVVGKLLGHKSTATTARYAHLDVDPLRRGTETIGNELQIALSGQRCEVDAAS